MWNPRKTHHDRSTSKMSAAVHIFFWVHKVRMMAHFTPKHTSVAHTHTQVVFSFSPLKCANKNNLEQKQLFARKRRYWVSIFSSALPSKSSAAESWFTQVSAAEREWNPQNSVSSSPRTVSESAGFLQIWVTMFDVVPSAIGDWLRLERRIRKSQEGVVLGWCHLFFPLFFYLFFVVWLRRHLTYFCLRLLHLSRSLLL